MKQNTLVHSAGICPPDDAAVPEIWDRVIRSHLEIRRFLVDPYFSTGYDNSAGDDNL